MAQPQSDKAHFSNIREFHLRPFGSSSKSCFVIVTSFVKMSRRQDVASGGIALATFYLMASVASYVALDCSAWKALAMIGGVDLLINLHLLNHPDQLEIYLAYLFQTIIGLQQLFFKISEEDLKESSWTILQDQVFFNVIFIWPRTLLMIYGFGALSGKQQFKSRFYLSGFTLIQRIIYNIF